ncbi:MAG: site-specific DNA-methyltransferase [Endomicrobium sp.]|nr:site-specific DNA-methyltransferase [Endomicrobium sp.]
MKSAVSLNDRQKTDLKKALYSSIDFRLTENAFYHNISVNKSDLAQSLLNIENKKRSNIFAWRGQFSPQFIEALLSKYVKNSDVVYDPFLGSGTILYECARVGVEAIGTEINVSAFYMSKFYELCNLNLYERQSLSEEIENSLFEINNSKQMTSAIKNSITLSRSQYVKNTLSLLMVILDLYTNPTLDKLFVKWENLKTNIINLPYCVKPITAINCDARYAGIPNDTVDVVITSPPYINVFNYHQQYRASVEALGFNVLDIAKQEFGSNRKHRGNRLFTVIQYCIDIALTFKELIRVSKDDSSFIFIVGRESKVLGIEICNSELVYNIATSIFKLPLSLKQERMFKNKFGQLIYEDILHLRNNKFHNMPSEQDVIDQARQIAKSYLKGKLDEISSGYKSYELILSAINNAEKIMKSEII